MVIAKTPPLPRPEPRICYSDFEPPGYFEMVMAEIGRCAWKEKASIAHIYKKSVNNG